MTPTARTLLFGDRPLSISERLDLQARIRQALAILPRLADEQAEIQQPCRSCGCVLWLPVKGGYRCAACMPPISLPSGLLKKIDATTERIKNE